MPQLPIYIPIVFMLTTVITLWLLYKASGCSKTVAAIAAGWLALQGIISSTGFYADTHILPPRFTLLVAPPFAAIILLPVTQRGRRLIKAMDIKTLTLLHTVRIPVELVLLWLYVHKTVPGFMTFEGRNFDIVSGITAPVVYYCTFIRKKPGRRLLIAWNIICMLLLFNIVIHAVLSAPFPFQQLAFSQPNIAVLHFPFTLLPGFIVPVVLLAHVAALTQLLSSGAGNTSSQ